MSIVYRASCEEEAELLKKFILKNIEKIEYIDEEYSVGEIMLLKTVIAEKVRKL